MIPFKKPLNRKAFFIISMLVGIGVAGFTVPFHGRNAIDQQRPIFDGKTLRGWKQIVGKANYKVEAGAIVGTTVVDAANSFLVTEQEYGDFILELDVKIDNVLSNSGIQTRSHFGGPAHPDKVYGRQVEIDPSPRSWSGGIYDEDRREWLYPLDKNPAAKSAFKVGQYNHVRIECIGMVTRTWINGVAAAHVIDPVDQSGFIGLQVHAVNKENEAGHKVYFKNITISTNKLEPKDFPADVPVTDLTGKSNK